MKRLWLFATAASLLFLLPSCSTEPPGSIVERVDLTRGICAVLGDQNGAAALQLARETDLLIYVQLETDDEVEAARRAADADGFYGNRIWVEKGAFTKVHLANNLADVLVALGAAANEISDAEALRVLCPQGRAR